MKLRIVDYQLCRGGVERFIEGVLSNLPEDEVELSVFTAGEALEGYRALVQRVSRPVTIVDVPTVTYMSAVRIGEQLAFPGPWAYETRPEFWSDVDLVWLPWHCRHVIPPQCAPKTVAHFHDNILVELGEYILGKRDLVGRGGQLYAMAMDDMLARRLTHSLARIVVSCQRTRNYLNQSYGPLPRDPAVIYLASGHITEIAPEPIDHLALPDRFLIYPAGLPPHKNHERLLAALAKVKADHPEHFLPLVLTGAGTQTIVSQEGHRGAYLKAWIEQLKLEIGRDVIVLGALTDGQYRAVLGSATAAVTPTLLEGGGTFSAGEAAMLGVPVASSNVEVMQEYISRLGIAALLFRPDSVDEMAKVLVRLSADEPELRTRAKAASGSLTDVTWEEIGRQYLAVFREQAQFAALHGKYVG